MTPCRNALNTGLIPCHNSNPEILSCNKYTHAPFPNHYRDYIFGICWSITWRYHTVIFWILVASFSWTKLRKKLHFFCSSAAPVATLINRDLTSKLSHTRPVQAVSLNSPVSPRQDLFNLPVQVSSSFVFSHFSFLRWTVRINSYGEVWASVFSVPLCLVSESETDLGSGVNLCEMSWLCLTLC